MTDLFRSRRFFRFPPRRLMERHGNVRRRWAVAGLGTALLLSVLTGCAGPQQTASPTPVVTAKGPPTTQPEASATASPSVRRGVVTIWLAWGPDEMQALGELIGAYQEQHPGVEFELVYHRPGTMKAAFEAAAEEGAVPSLLLGSSEWGPAWMDDGLIRDVSQVILTEHRQAVYPLAWEQVEREGRVVGLPLELQGTVLYRNTALAPDPSDTVGDLVTEATDGRAEGLPGAYFDLGFRQAAPLLRTCKGELVFDETVDPVGRPQGLCWLRLLDRLARAGPVTFNGDEDLQAFLAGDSRWVLESTEALIRLQEAVGASNVAVDPWPIYASTGEPLKGYVWSENAYFPTGSSDRAFEAAWSFAIYLLAADNQRVLSDRVGVNHIPSRDGVELSNPQLRAARRVLLEGISLPVGRGVEEVARELETAVRLVAGQGGQPELALDLALNEIREARVPTATPSRTPAPTLTHTPTGTPGPSPPPG